MPSGAAYPAIQRGVLDLTKSAALKHASIGLRIAAICPEWVERLPVSSYMRRDNVAAAKIVRQTPRDRIASAGKTAEGVLWLRLNAASFIIGSPLVMDDGATWLEQEKRVCCPAHPALAPAEEATAEFDTM